MTATLPKWLEDELRAWLEHARIGSLTFHSDGHRVTKIERHEFVKAPVE